MDTTKLEEIIVDLYRKTATELPEDVFDSIKTSKTTENGLARNIVESIIKNSEISKEKSIPICQDTGTPIFYVEYGKGMNEEAIKKIILKATTRATKEVPLRPNAVNSITGTNLNENIGIFFPVIYFTQKNMNGLKISLLLKGGGSENMGHRYALPDSKLSAGRNIDGVRKCILDAIHKAQGKGCSPGIISVCIGGSKDVIAFLAKKQLCEKLLRKNKNSELNLLEKRIIKEANSLGIGPMGLGGNSTVLDVKICETHRHPASYFVEVAYSCWALRRYTINISNEGKVSYGHVEITDSY